MTTLMVNLSGLLLMAAIVWWFWLYRPAAAAQPDKGTTDKEDYPQGSKDALSNDANEGENNQ